MKQSLISLVAAIAFLIACLVLIEMADKRCTKGCVERFGEDSRLLCEIRCKEH